jgi:aryl-alcohol dehydrogenase-like predicted oxidoreductase
MKHISIGGLDVSRLGLGAMSMSGYYNTDAINDTESIRAIHRALDLGVTHLDTAEIYGPYSNEELVGRAIKDRRDQVEFGIVSHAGGGPGVLDSSPANIRAAVEGSLKRLATDHIDLYYQHRVDPNTSIEDTVGALAELVVEGKVRYGGSNTGTDRIGLAAGAGGRHCPDSRHQTRRPRRGEHRRRPHRAERWTDRTAEQPHAGRGRAARRRQHGRHRPLTTARQCLTPETPMPEST